MCRERCGIDLGYVVVSRTSKALGGALHIAPRNVAVDYRAVKPAERIPMVGDDVDGGCFNTQFFQVVKPPFAGRNKTQACEDRSEEHTSELQSLMRISYAVFCLQKKTQQNQQI